MIVTITPAPSIDWTIGVDAFEFDAVNRIVNSSREASGKGVNVSWALHRAGIPTTAIFPAGAETGAFMARSLAAAGLAHVIEPIDHDVRTNITLISPGHSTKINEPGAPLSPPQVENFRRTILASSAGADMALICGSLPQGLDDDFQGAMVRELHAIDVPVVVDTSGAPLKLALTSRPDLIKPNVHELAELVGTPIATVGDVITAAEQAMALGAAAVLASLGGDGAMLIDAAGALYARAERIPFVNSVGAGDALLAGFVGGGPDRADRLRNAVLWASSAVAHPTTIFPVRPEFAGRIHLETSPSRDQLLSEPSAALVAATRTASELSLGQ